jgi:hypothetical protein
MILTAVVIRRLGGFADSGDYARKWQKKLPDSMLNHVESSIETRHFRAAKGRFIE